MLGIVVLAGLLLAFGTLYAGPWRGFNLCPTSCPTCAAPCTYSLTIDPQYCTNRYLTGATVHFAGPLGESITLVSGAASPSISSPSAGTWTITITHPCCLSAEFTVDVVECVSQGIAYPLSLNFTSIDYSDDYGSCTCSNTPACVFVGSYAYTSADAIDMASCGGSPLWLHGQSAGVGVEVTIGIAIDYSTITYTILRTLDAAPARMSCADPTQKFGKLADSQAYAFTCEVYSSGQVSADCGASATGGLDPLFTPGASNPLHLGTCNNGVFGVTNTSELAIVAATCVPV